ncbi:MAG: hypothetical protein SEPTF4163_006200 [Sporothrix epigloea]
MGASTIPTQRSFAGQQAAATLPANPPRNGADRDGLQVPTSSHNVAATVGGRSLASSSAMFMTRGSSLNPSPAPGSFVSEIRLQPPLSRGGSRLDLYNQEKLTNIDDEDEDGDDADVQCSLAALRDLLNRELKIKEGSENMLEALHSKKAKQTKDQRVRVEAELSSSNHRIRELQKKITEVQRPRPMPSTPTKVRPDLPAGVRNDARSPQHTSRSEAASDLDEQTESPTFVLAEILQALEVEGMRPEYYVARANGLVELFKRHPTLKYDLAWSVFGLRIQGMLLSDSREIVAAAYRMTRYAISDVASLKKIRTLNTDYLVVLSLIKDRKADVEREQALKFVRAFLDTKDGVSEVSRAIVRTIAAVAEQGEDRLRPICLETLAEILVRDPGLLIASGGLAVLSDALFEGSYKAPESLTSAILFLLDAPQRRKYLRSGHELEVLFAPFTDHYISTDAILKRNAKAISSALSTWSGIMTLSMYNFRAIRSLVASLAMPNIAVRETVIELICSLLRIKSPAWAASFLAGRRLTTYGRVASLKSAGTKISSLSSAEDDGGEQNFVEHYTALLLAVFIKADLLPHLLHLTQETDNFMLKRRSTLLIGEVLRLSSRLLPPSWSRELQMLPELFAAAARFGDESHSIATGTVYQISSVTRTLFRSSPSYWAGAGDLSHNSVDFSSLLDEQHRTGASMSFDEATFRQLQLDSGVVNSSNPLKWDWDVILKIIEGPLTNGKRLEEAIRASKFVKRLMSFYRPFKYKFSDMKNTKATQKYVRVGCALLHTLLLTTEGFRYLGDSKLLRQIAECLAQCDPTSGITAQFPMFAKDRLTDTLCGGYLPMIGVLSSDPRGLQMMERWRMFNMMYHIIDLKQRPDLIKLLLSNFDYSLNGHQRVLLSKALTAGTKDIRIHATNVLRKYAVRSNSKTMLNEGVGNSKWAIQLLVTQLYDPEVEVCATAVKTLEIACNSKHSLEFIVECRPALDHLGEIGAPLLLRFLSTSIGYHYLDGLDYISNEMDDWFLGRNDAYVDLIEASLARAFVEGFHEQAGRIPDFAGESDADADTQIPPHFYRELTRTEEGCRLLREKGHFDDFATTIRDYGMQTTDVEMITKVKGCLWAVGNVGAMELGAPFLESCDVVEQVVKIAQHQKIMSLRGTAFFVIGLISRSLHGLEILSEFGWDSNTNIVGASLGFCIPTDLSQLFSLSPWEHTPAASIQLPLSQKMGNLEVPVIPFRPRAGTSSGDDSLDLANKTKAVEDTTALDPDPICNRILELVVDMGNIIIFKRAAAELMQIKQKGNTAAFRQPQLFRKVLLLLECRHYRLQIRRMILDMFDKSVLRSIVFEEDESESDMEEEEKDRIAAGAHRPEKSRTSIRGILERHPLQHRRAHRGQPRQDDDDDDDDDDEDEDDDGDEENEDSDSLSEDTGEEGETSGTGDGEDEGEGEDNSGDEQMTERQRSISDTAQLQRGNTAGKGP